MTTAQQYIDDEITHHEAQLAGAGLVDTMTHLAALIRLRRIRATQYRPRLVIPQPLTAEDAAALTWHEPAIVLEQGTEWDTDADNAYRARLQLERHLPYIETPQPPTSPIYALLRESRGWDRA